MTDVPIVVRVTTAGTQIATTEIHNLRREITDTGTASKQTGGDVGLLGKAVGVLGGALAAISIGDTARQLFEIGDASLKAERGLVGLTGSVAAADEITRAMKDGTGGLLTATDAQLQASRLLSLGMADNAEEAREFAEVASTLGAVINQDAASSIEQLSLAVANVSYERLDALGISAGEVRESVRELKEEGYGLEEAFRMATLEEANEKLDELEAAGFEAGTSLERLTVKAKDAAAAAGEVLASGILAVTDAIEPAIERADAFAIAHAAMRDAMEETGESLQRVTELQGEYQVGLGGTEYQTEAATQAQREATRVTYDLAEAFLENATAAGLSRGEAANLYMELTGLNTVYLLLANSAYVARDATFDSANGIGAAGESAAWATPRIWAFKDALDAVEGAQASGGKRPAVNPRMFREARDVQFGDVSGLNDFYQDDYRKSFVLDQQQRMFASWEESAKTAAGGAGRALSTAANDSEKAWNKAISEIDSAISKGMDLSTAVSENDMILTAAGTYKDKFNEAGRRLGSVIAEGASSQWADDFFGDISQYSNDQLKGMAAQLQQDIADFQRPDLLNESAGLDQARRQLIGDANRREMAERWRQQLINEGFADAQIQQALGEQLGVAFTGAGQIATPELVDTIANTLSTGIRDKEQEWIELGNIVGKGLREGIRAQMVQVASEVFEAIAEAAEAG